jgi:hypothetical protein
MEKFHYDLKDKKPFTPVFPHIPKAGGATQGFVAKLSRRFPVGLAGSSLYIRPWFLQPQLQHVGCEMRTRLNGSVDKHVKEIKRKMRLLKINNEQNRQSYRMASCKA